MKKSPLWILGVLFLFFSTTALAQLQSSDPKNFFTLLDGADWIGRVSLKSSEAPKATRRFFLFQLKVSETLKGAKPDRLLVLDEALIPGSPPLLTDKGEFLIFLSPLPPYTAYQELRRQGYEYRVMGGKSGALPMSESTLKLAKSYLGSDAKDRDALLISALKSEDSRIANDAAEKLATRAKIIFSSEDIASVLVALREGRLQDSSQVGLVRALENSGNAVSVDALKKLAEEPPSAAKWAALRALERLGIPRSMDRLAEDFQKANDAEKLQALALIVSRKNEEAEGFLAALLSGNMSLELKKTALRQMAENKTPGYEALLIKGLGQGETLLRAESVLALGRMSSSHAVPHIIPLLDSPESPLRAAAFLMLSESPDPRAQEVISQRFSRDHHGVWEQNQHFYGNTGTGQTP